VRIDQRFGAQHVSQFRDGADESHAWSLVSILSGLIFCLLHPGVNRNLDVSGYGAHASSIVTDIAKPRVRPGQVLIKIGAAGVCHSDLHLMEEDLGFTGQFTLGHENAGWIAELGESVDGFKEGDAVAVYGPWGCGHCHACQQSMENYCENHASLRGFGGGLGFDGDMAEYMLVPSARFIVSLASLDPKKAAPLTDAALTPYHAIKRALPLLHSDSTVVIFGLGGLGHMAVQLMRILSPVRIIAGDIDPVKLEHARSLGADETVNTRDSAAAAEQILKLTGPRGAGLVLDCTGVQPTIDLGAKLLGRNSAWTIVGLGGGRHDFHHGSTPYGSVVTIPYWGSRIELMEVIAMARDGRIHADTTEFPLAQAVDVYRKLKAGQIKGRRVGARCCLTQTHVVSITRRRMINTNAAPARGDAGFVLARLTKNLSSTNGEQQWQTLTHIQTRNSRSLFSPPRFVPNPSTTSSRRWLLEYQSRMVLPSIWRPCAILTSHLMTAIWKQRRVFRQGRRVCVGALRTTTLSLFHRPSTTGRCPVC